MRRKHAAENLWCFHFPLQQRWTAVFLKFQSQSWHTDDVTGHTFSLPHGDEAVNPHPIVPQPSLFRCMQAILASVIDPNVVIITPAYTLSS
ncbi:MAG: DUF2278 family protein [Nitrosospira sp.]